MAKIKNFHGLTALITGASSGIGRLLATRLATAGARVIVVARRAEVLAELVREIETAGGEALALPCDVGDLEAVTRLGEAIRKQGIAIDILVNNAGYGHHRPFLQWDIADQERMMRVNYLGSMYVTKMLIPEMIRRGGGTLVFIASVAGKIGTPDESAYAASKFAMVGLGEALSIELEEHGIHVLTVCPGAIRTPFFDAQALARMPKVALDSMVEPGKLVDAIFRSLARGEHELTYPRGIRAGYIVKALLPSFMRRQVKRVTWQTGKSRA